VSNDVVVDDAVWTMMWCLMVWWLMTSCVDDGRAAIDDVVWLTMWVELN
jgi:hypothetical protein